KVVLAAVDWPSKKIVSPPMVLKVASPAVAVLVNVILIGLVKVALPAVEVDPKNIWPPVKAVKLPAVALLRNSICVAPLISSKFCTTPELFVLPLPLMFIVGWAVKLVEMVNALAPGLNTMPLSSISNAKMSMFVRLEDANVAVSPGALGMVPCTQLFMLNHSRL